MNRDVEIEFMDGTKRIISKVTNMSVENGVLSLTHRYSGGIGYFSESSDLGSFPIVNVKSYRWME